MIRARNEVERPDLPSGIVELLEQATEVMLLGTGDARLEAIYKNAVGYTTSPVLKV